MLNFPIPTTQQIFDPILMPWSDRLERDLLWTPPPCCRIIRTPELSWNFFWALRPEYILSFKGSRKKILMDGGTLVFQITSTADACLMHYLSTMMILGYFKFLSACVLETCSIQIHIWYRYTAYPIYLVWLADLISDISYNILDVFLIHFK
jgi:hypothetical protein